MRFLRFAAATFAYLLAVTLPVPIATLAVSGWRVALARLSSRRPRFIGELLALTALAASLRALAAGLLFLRRSRPGLPWVRPAEGSPSSLIFGAVAWYGVSLAAYAITVALGAVHGSLWSLTWTASGPICFATAATGGEVLLQRSKVGSRGLVPTTS